MSHNRNELIAPCQQGRVLMAVRGECVKLLTCSGSDESGLGHWNWVQTQNQDRKIRVISAYQAVKSRQTQNTMYNQQLRFFRLSN